VGLSSRSNNLPEFSKKLVQGKPFFPIFEWITLRMMYGKLEDDGDAEEGRVVYNIPRLRKTNRRTSTSSSHVNYLNPQHQFLNVSRYSSLSVLCVLCDVLPVASSFLRFSTTAWLEPALVLCHSLP
jgi:hypothetical protein